MRIRKPVFCISEVVPMVAVFGNNYLFRVLVNYKTNLNFE